MERDNGFYFVKWNGCKDWTIEEFVDGSWIIDGKLFTDDSFDLIYSGRVLSHDEIVPQFISQL